MQNIEQVNKAIEEKFNSMSTPDEKSLQELLHYAEKLYDKIQMVSNRYEAKDEIIPYDVLLLEHNIAKIKELLPEKKDDIGKAL